MLLIDAIKERELGKWALAYLGGAWLLLEVSAYLGESFGWPGWVNRVLIVVVAVGFVATLILAWYHGEQGRQSVSGPELLILATLFGMGAGSLTCRGGRSL